MAGRNGTRPQAMTDQRLRLDVQLVHDGRAPTRSRAQVLIGEGQVRVNGRVERRNGRVVGPHDRIDVTPAKHFVSRGGVKLAHALTEFEIHPQGWRVVDVGASTGGFTECWLEAGAAKVFAVDVGHGQLAEALRRDGRVVSLEGTNARHLTPAFFGADWPLDGASVDASFIGLHLLLRPLMRLVSRSGSIVALVKPQFEAGPRRVGKGGVVRNPDTHVAVLQRVLQDSQSLGLTVRNLTHSPIRGPEGNIEFLLHLGLDPNRANKVDIAAVVRAAWDKGGRDG